jgi:3-deoxy-manno-octulosonate cytidylyltransferase (CMP-KDO synthetase)
MIATSRVTIAIPARIGSKRIPLKPLVAIDGKPLVVRVVEAALACDAAEEVVVITDSLDVADAVRGRCDVLIENRNAWCGTQRLAMGWQRVPSLFPSRHEPCGLIINWQLDEPFVRPDDVCGLVLLGAVANDPRHVATLVSRTKPLTLCRPDVAKARVSPLDDCGHGDAVSFSRSQRDVTHGRRHLGVYCFSAPALWAIGRLAQTARARRHNLEQLAWANAGFKIMTAEVQEPPASIHTLDDVREANEMIAGCSRHVVIKAAKPRH